MKRTIFILTALLAATAHAQDLSTEITVERDVELALPKASPLPGVFPSMPQLLGTRPDIRPVKYSRAADFGGTAAPDSLALHNGTEAPDSRRGYLWAGYFPIYNLAAAAGYRIVDTQDTHIDAAASFNGYSYDSATRNFGKQSVSNNTFTIGTSASHRLGRQCRIWLDAEYRHAALKSPTRWPRTQKQGIDAATITLGTDGSHKLFNYRIKALYQTVHLAKDIVMSREIYAPEHPSDYYRYADFPAASDDNFKFDADLNLALDNKHIQNIGLRVGIDALHRHGEMMYSMFKHFKTPHCSPFIVSITPSYSFKTEIFKLRLGARFDICHNTEGHSFNVAPDIKATWLPDPHFSAYLSATGGEDFFTLTDKYNYSPFLPSYYASVSRFTPVDARFGIGIRPFGSLTIDLFGSYAAVRRQGMIESANFEPLICSTDIHGWSVGAKAEYNYDKYLSLKAQAKLYPHSYSGASAEALDRAKFALSASLTVKPVDRLCLDMTYSLRTGRQYYHTKGILKTVQLQDGSFAEVTWPETTPKSMGNICDLCLGGSYAITPAFDVFVRLENILAKRYVIIPNLHSQGFNGLAGISLRL